MRIETLKIHNFRSIRDLETQCPSLMVLLGPNNHGKSNILAALEFFLTPGRKVERSDLFDFDTRTDDEIWIEVSFGELTAQEEKTFKKYVQSNGRLQVRKVAILEGDVASIRYQGWLEEPSEEWLKGDNAGNYKKAADLDGTGLYELLKEEGRLSKAKVENAQQEYIAEHREELTLNLVLETANFLGSKSVAVGLLPEFYLVPAVRDLSDETKIKSTALLGRLVNRAIQIMSEKDPAFLEIQKQLEAQIALLNEKDPNNQPKIEQIREIKSGLEEELKAWGVKIDLEIETPPIDKIFELGTYLHLDDGIRTLAEKKGHGLQRALIFALLKTWASLIRQKPEEEGSDETKPRVSSESVYFAVEEPELFLHPHAQRGLAESLVALSEADGGQVFVCTHSSHFVDMERYQSICLVSKPNPTEGSMIRQCTKDLFPGDDNKAKKNRLNMAYWINPDRGEMFFARRVVFVEGATEKTVIPFLAKRIRIFDNEVSIIDCGSKQNLPLYMKIANAFRLNYIVVHDEDTPGDQTNIEIQDLLDSTLGKVIVLSAKFEEAAGMSEARGRGKPLQALEYFEDKNESKIPDTIRDLVSTVYSP